VPRAYAIGTLFFTRPVSRNLGTAGPGVVVGLGSCASVTAGWIAILETAHPNKPTVWRNVADDNFKASGKGLFPAVTPR
jgi:hypothetical protein